MGSDLLQSFQVLSELGVNTVGNELSPVALANISLSVEEPLGDVVIYIIRRVRGEETSAYRWAWQGCR